MLRSILNAFCLFSLPLTAAGQPNIVFIFSDDHSPNAIGAYNRWLKSVNPTPAIDRLAAQGMLFERSYCTNSICGPVRAVIETGKHSHKNGFRRNGDAFDWDQPTFPKLLRNAGYQTILYGKYHLGGTPQGYDEWKALPGQGDYYNPDFITPEGDIRIEGHATDVVTEMAIKWLKEKRDPGRPFMLRVQHKAPHRNWMPALRHLDIYDDVLIPEPPTLFHDHRTQASPSRHQEMEIDRHMCLHHDLFLDLTPDVRPPLFQPRQDASAWGNMHKMTQAQLTTWRAHYGPQDEDFHVANLEGAALVRWKHQRYLRNYLGCVKGVDESVETLMNTLDELGLAGNTLVIYSSDQGFYLGDRGWYDKRWMYDTSLEMPLIVKWPGVTAPGSRNTDLVQNLDYASTFLEIAGVEIPRDYQGRSIVPLLKGQTPDDWRDAIYYHYFEYPGSHMVAAHRGVRTARFKLIHLYPFGEWEFYDLDADPQELTNQYENPIYSTIVTGLKSRLDELATQYEDDTDVSEKPDVWKNRMREPVRQPTD
ncbi:MAG: sulfatase [Luteolibacter sp.]